MFTGERIRIRDLRLDLKPGLRELYLFKVMHEPKECSRLTWTGDTADREFCLTLRTDNIERIADWRLHTTVSGAAHPVWSATTNDILQIYKLIDSLPLPLKPDTATRPPA